MTTDERELKALEARLGHRFTEPRLLVQALTHRSFANEHPAAVHNERLEFLGDAVLGLHVSDALFARCATSREGELSRRRASLVNARSLASLARELALGPLLQLGRGELQSGGADKPSLLADAFEALIGAIYVDGGPAAAAAVLDRLLEPALRRAVDDDAARDPKSALQERTQRDGHGLPTYQLLGTEGPDHARRYVVQVGVAGAPGRTAEGRGPSKKCAERAAAQALLRALDGQDP